MKDLISKQWIKESILLLLFMAVVIAIALPRSLFGLSMTDEGWLLNAYQYIFSFPSSVPSVISGFSFFPLSSSLLIGKYFSK